MRIHKAIEHNIGQRVFFEFGSCVILQQGTFCAVIKTAFASIPLNCSGYQPKNAAPANLIPCKFYCLLTVEDKLGIAAASALNLHTP